MAIDQQLEAMIEIIRTLPMHELIKHVEDSLPAQVVLSIHPITREEAPAVYEKLDRHANDTNCTAYTKPARVVIQPQRVDPQTGEETDGLGGIETCYIIAQVLHSNKMCQALTLAWLKRLNSEKASSVQESIGDHISNIEALRQFVRRFLEEDLDR